jgi:predicted RNA-binding protein YlxR (DUF448 family)
VKPTAPIRLCIGCGSRDGQSNLIRFTISPEGLLTVGAGNGRGGYLHRRRQCVQAFATTRAGMVRSLGVVLSREARKQYAALIEQRVTQWAEK